MCPKQYCLLWDVSFSESIVTSPFTNNTSCLPVHPALQKSPINHPSMVYASSSSMCQPQYTKICWIQGWYCEQDYDHYQLSLRTIIFLMQILHSHHSCFTKPPVPQKMTCFSMHAHVLSQSMSYVLYAATRKRDAKQLWKLGQMRAEGCKDHLLTFFQYCDIITNASDIIITSRGAHC